MDPYQPPKTDIVDPAAAVPGSSVKAVALGLLVDIVGTVLSSVVMGMVYSGYLAVEGVAEDRIPERLQEAFSHGWMFAIATAAGCGFSLLGGYICARISRRRDYSLAFVLSAISVALALLLGWGSYSGSDLLLLVAMTVACIFIGTKIAMRRLPVARLAGS